MLQLAEYYSFQKEKNQPGLLIENLSWDDKIFQGLSVLGHVTYVLEKLYNILEKHVFRYNVYVRQGLDLWIRNPGRDCYNFVFLKMLQNQLFYETLLFITFKFPFL